MQYEQQSHYSSNQRQKSAKVEDRHQDKADDWPSHEQKMRPRPDSLRCAEEFVEDSTAGRWCREICAATGAAKQATGGIRMTASTMGLSPGTTTESATLGP